jgi:transcriptional regulator with XRE-family HTH domain
MPKPKKHISSRASRHAVVLLGRLIREARIEKKLTTRVLAERAGISRGLVQRIEKGEPGCAIGAVFEVATIVGVWLFDPDKAALNSAISASRKILTLMPKAARAPKIKVKDDF